jgi:hypothetical protein
MAGLLFLVAPAASQRSDRPANRTGDILVTPYSPGGVRIPYLPPTPGDSLPHEDEVALAGALSLIRTGRTDEGLEELLALLERHPASPRLISASSTAWTRLGDPKEALRVLSRGTRRLKDEARRRESEDTQSSLPTFSAERAEAYVALGKPKKAIPWMVEACALQSAQSQQLRMLLLDWASDPELGPAVAREAGKRSDKNPGDMPLALLAAELEALAGQWDRVWPRLERAEIESGQAHRGELLRALASRMSSRPGSPAGADAAIWLELARGPYENQVRSYPTTAKRTPHRRTARHLLACRGSCLGLGHAANRDGTGSPGAGTHRLSARARRVGSGAARRR